MMIRWWWWWWWWCRDDDDGDDDDDNDDDDDDGGGGDDDDVDVDVVSNGQYSTSSPFITTMMVGVFLLFLTIEAIISFIPRLEFDEFRGVGVNRWPTVDLL